MTSAIATKTIKIEFTNAPLIRCQATKDMPEVGILEGSIFYLVRSSKDNGEYYISTWSYERMMWTCSCPATINNCRHNRLVSADCHKSGHTLFSYKPVTPCRGEAVAADKAATFASLFKKFDVRQTEKAAKHVVTDRGIISNGVRISGGYTRDQATLAQAMNSQVQAILNGEVVKAAPGAFCLAR
jgi:hypothetical protein